MDDITLSQIIAWLIIGAIAGTLAARLVKGSKRGFGPFGNIAVGLIGAVIGGFLFSVLFDTDLGLGNITISLADLVAAFVGSLIFLGVLAFFRNR